MPPIFFAPATILCVFFAPAQWFGAVLKTRSEILAVKGAEIRGGFQWKNVTKKTVTAEPAAQRLGSAPAPVRCTPQGTSAPSVHWYARFRWTEMRIAASLAMDAKTALIAKFALVQHRPRVPTQKERKTSNLRVSKNPLANVRKGWKQCKQRERRKTLQASKRQTQLVFWFLLPRGGLRVVVQYLRLF